MKRLALPLALACCSVLSAQTVTTPNLKLKEPPVGSAGWGPQVNSDFSIIDAVVGSLLNPYQGAWSNLLSYAPGQFVSYQGITYIAAAANINAIPGISPSWQVLSATAWGKIVGSVADQADLTAYVATQIKTVTGDETYVSPLLFSDLGAALASADATYAGKQAVYLISTLGTISTAPTLSAGHSLHITAPVKFAAPVNLTTDNDISCAPGVPMTSTIPDNNQNGIFVGTGAEPERISIHGCNLTGTSPNRLFYSPGPTQDVDLYDNHLHNATLYKQQGAGIANPTLRLQIHDNSTFWDATYPNSTSPSRIDYDITIYGAYQDSSVIANVATGSGFFESYATSSKGVQPFEFPTEDQIASGGVANDVIADNVCSKSTGDGGGAVACVFTAVGYRVLVANNTANVVSDVCFDAESSAHVVFVGNHASHCKNGQFSVFYSSYDNVFKGNYAVSYGDDAPFSLRNSSNSPANSERTQIVGNDIRCAVIGGICAFAYFESTDQTNIQGNTLYNMRGASPAPGTYSSNTHYTDNEWLFDVAIPNGQYSPINLPNMLGGVSSDAVGNRIRTTVAQTVPAIQGGTSDFNYNETYKIIGNLFEGPWGTDVSVVDSANNQAFTLYVILRNNQYASGVLSMSGIVTKISSNNYIGGGSTAQ